MKQINIYKNSIHIKIYNKACYYWNGESKRMVLTMYKNETISIDVNLTEKEWINCCAK